MAVSGQFDHEVRVGVVRVQARSRVFVIVVEREHGSLRVGEFDQGVHGRVEASRVDFDGHYLSDPALEAEHIPVIRTITPPVDNDRELHSLCVPQVVIAFPLETLR